MKPSNFRMNLLLEAYIFMPGVETPVYFHNVPNGTIIDKYNQSTFCFNVPKGLKENRPVLQCRS